MDGRQVVDFFEKMRVERGNMEGLWRECIRYCLPYDREFYDDTGITDTTPGKRRASPVCSLPVIYANRLASSLHNSLFPATDYWCAFGFAGVDMSRDENARRWAFYARDAWHEKIRQGTNFYQETHTMMLGLAVLGMGGFYTYYKNGGLHFRYIPINKNFYVARNSDGDIDMAAILHDYTAKEAVEEFGAENVSRECLDALYNGNDSIQRFAFIQLVYPKKTFGEPYDLNKGGKPIGDVVVEKDTARVVRVSGHLRFPFATPRFVMASDELYGRSPAMNTMSAIREANGLRKNILEATLRAIKPAIFINSLVNVPISIASGSVNRIQNFDPNSIWTFPQPTDFSVAKEEMASVNEDLKQGFFIDVFQALEQTSRMTATEVTERVRQKVESVSPIVSRLHWEFTRKVVMHSLMLLIENGDIEPPPEYLGDWRNSLTIRHTSSLDMMLNQGVNAKTMNFVSQATMLAQLQAANPDVNNVLDTDAMLENLAENNMLPAKFFRTREEREAMRQQAAEAAQDAAESQNEAQSAQAALNYAKADAVQSGRGYNGFN